MRKIERQEFVRFVAAVALIVCGASLANAQTSKAAAFRSITINTQPKAKVWINGVFYGTASEGGSFTIRTVPPGRRTIRVRADGFTEAQKILAPTQTGIIAVPLTETKDPAVLAFQEAERLTLVDRQKAMAKYEEAIKLRPDYMDAHIGLARVQLDASEYEKANRTVGAARKIRPAVAELSALEGRILKGFFEEEKAIAAFKRAIREGGGFQPEAYAGLGLLYKDKAERAAAARESAQEKAFYAEAAKYLAIAIEQLSGAPDAVVMYQLLGLIYEDQKLPAKAIGVYEEFLNHFPDHPQALTFRSFIVQLKKQAAQ